MLREVGLPKQVFDVTFKKGEFPESLKDYTVELDKKEISFEDATGRDNIKRFDKKSKAAKRKGMRNKYRKNRKKTKDKTRGNETK